MVVSNRLAASHAPGVVAYREGDALPQTGMSSLDRLSDEELLGLARLPEAFAVFYRRHVGSIIGFFVRRTTCHETAADLTAETFARPTCHCTDTTRPGHRRRHGSPDRRHQLAHFLRAAEVASRARRRLGVRPVPAGDEPFETLMASFDARLNGPTLRVAMDELTNGVAEAVRFRVIDGLAYAEVAARLGCSEAAARQRVACGLSHLSEQRSVTDVGSTGGGSMSTTATYVDRLEHELLGAIGRRRRKRTVLAGLAAMTAVTAAVVGAVVLTGQKSPYLLWPSTLRGGSSPALATDIKGPTGGGFRGGRLRGEQPGAFLLAV